MPFTRKTRIALAVLCALPLLATAEEGLQLKSQPTLLLIPKNDDPLPLFIEADRLQGTQDRETEAYGSARLRRRGQAFYADWMRHDKPTELLNAEGNIRIEQDRTILLGDKLRYELATDRGEMENPRYTLLSPPTAIPVAACATGFAGSDGRGTAERLLFEGPEQYRAEKAVYTTCEVGNDSWFIRAKRIDIDREKDEGVARDASIVFLGVPILYTPYLSFSLGNQRASGFLTPSYRNSNTTGVEFTLPYYWNIAPDMDATFFPRYMTKRGMQLGSEFRYLNPAWRGEVRAEILPSDQQTGEDRWGLFTKHQQTFSNGWSGNLNLNRVSDGKYFTELSTLVAVTSQVNLTNDVTLARGGTWGDGGTYNFSAFAQRWQTLQTDILNPITPLYNRQPQLTLNAQRQSNVWGDFDLQSSFAAFDHPTLVNGNRLVTYPSIALPLQTASTFITPKFGVHTTQYFITGNNAANLRDTTRALPIFSAESGLVFERAMGAGDQPLIQTFEPKVAYLYIPRRNQSRLPNFDSGLQDINFATLFAENQFSGQDRINDANRVTWSATSRFISADSGIERLRVGIAQRYFLQTQRVTLPGVVVPGTDAGSSDIVGLVSGNMARNWTAEAGWLYNTDRNQSQKFNIATRYQPERGKVLNFAYRDTRDVLRNVDVSGQWALGNGWSGVGRWNFSTRDNRTLESLFGAEYNDCCWSLRILAHRFATTNSAASTSFLLQLELGGLSRAGTDALNVLNRNISGYRKFDPRSSSPVEYNVPGVF